MKRIFAIGDIHGCLDKVETLLSKLPIDWSSDLLVFLGDYVDRGPDPAGVVQLMIELKAEHPGRVICLKGNHEAMFLDFLKGGPLSRAFINFGGKNTLNSYGIPLDTELPRERHMPKSHLQFLKSLPLCLETPKFFLVHAGVKPGKPLKAQTEEDMLWIRHEFIKSEYDWGKRIIFGHTSFDTPFITHNKIGIDTGAVYGGRLTCLVLPEVDFLFA
ncbi:MAG: serine/threonine protein phosphatase [Thermodesulfobacteria bacterium]|nr:serine/threonine protein phosphatase [Thermodesulfobacteriota bacterium]